MTTPSEIERSFRAASDKFHEILSALSVEDLLTARSGEDILTKSRNAVVQEKLRGKLRTRDQLRRIAADGFELCVRALAEMGAKDVTIFSCSEEDLEGHW